MTTVQEAAEKDPTMRKVIACAASMGNCIIKKHKVKPRHTPDCIFIMMMGLAANCAQSNSEVGIIFDEFADGLAELVQKYRNQRPAHQKH